MRDIYVYFAWYYTCDIFFEYDIDIELNQSTFSDWAKFHWTCDMKLPVGLALS